MIETELPKRAWVEQIMGLPISIHLRGNGVRTDLADEVVTRAFRRLRWIDGVFSTYRDDSPISALRRGEVRVDELVGAVGYIVDVCAEASLVTGGAFTADLPDPDSVIRFDPSGAVKGWAIGEAGKILADLDDHSFCINAGGDICVGTATNCVPEIAQASWRVGLQDPHRPDAIARTIELRTGALATSGLYARGRHLFDPATGSYPDRPGSVTVTGPDIMWADIWATAIFVGGPSTQELLRHWDSSYSVTLLA